MMSTPRFRKRALVLLALPLTALALPWNDGPEAAAQDPAGAAPKPILLLEDWPLSPSATRGRESYGRWCAGCHGADGRGRGPAARFLDPLPRDFQAGRIKFRSTASGSLPLAEDLMRTIARGLPGSSMPAFPLVPELERRDLAEYVIALVQFGRASRDAAGLQDDGVTREQLLKEHLPRLADEAKTERAAVRPVPVSEENADDAASRARGLAKYTELCAGCHGASGRGDGSAAPTLRDDLDAPILPRDFTVGILRGGDSPEDIFRRLRTGLDGTPMPAFRDDGATLWDIVHHVMTLRTTPGTKEVR